MKTFRFEELPENFYNVYANKLYNEILQDKIIYDENTIDNIIKIFIKREEYEKCQDLVEIRKKYKEYYDNK